MNSIFNPYTDDSEEDDLQQAKQIARDRLLMYKKRAALAAITFALTCAAVSLFLEGQTLQAYSTSFGKYILFLCMGLLVVFVNYGALLWSAYSCLRELEKDR